MAADFISNPSVARAALDRRSTTRSSGNFCEAGRAKLPNMGLDGETFFLAAHANAAARLLAVQAGGSSEAGSSTTARAGALQARGGSRSVPLAAASRPTGSRGSSRADRIAPPITSRGCSGAAQGDCVPRAKASDVGQEALAARLRGRSHHSRHAAIAW